MDKAKYIWSNGDLLKALAYGLLVGFLVGAVVGYNIGYEPPPVKMYKPLIG